MSLIKLKNGTFIGTASCLLSLISYLFSMRLPRKMYQPRQSSMEKPNEKDDSIESHIEFK